MVVLAVCVAGCGPPKGKTPGVYSLDATAKCLKKAGLVVAVNPADLDFVSATAPEGALRSARDGKQFVIAFGSTRADSDLLVRGYRRSARTRLERKRLNSLLDLEGNSVAYWQTEPTDAEKGFVRGCLQ